MIAYIGYILLAVAIVLGLWRGGGPERTIAAIVAAMFTVDRVAHLLLGDANTTALDPFHLVLDLTALAAMVTVALHAKRYWPIWASSSQLISVFTHTAWLLKTPIPLPVYRVLDMATSLLITILLIIGTVLHRRRIAMRGTDASWKGS